MFNRNLQPNFDKQAHQYDVATPIQHDTVTTLAKLIHAHFSPPPFQKTLSQLTLPQSILPQSTFSQSMLSQMTWLDIGCGTGRLSQAVLQQMENDKALAKEETPETSSNGNRLVWYGLDNSPNMLAIFEQNLVNFQVKYTDFSYQVLLADMQSIPLPANHINQILSSFALHWVGAGQVDKMVAELGRVLVPNGQIHVAIPVAGSLSALHQRCPTLPIFPFATADNWLNSFASLIEGEGGRWLYQMTQGFSHTYPNMRVLLKSLKHMGGTFSQGHRDTLVMLKNLRHCVADEKPIALDYQVLLVGLTLTK